MQSHSNFITEIKQTTRKKKNQHSSTHRELAVLKLAKEESLNQSCQQERLLPNLPLPEFPKHWALVIKGVPANPHCSACLHQEPAPC